MGIKIRVNGKLVDSSEVPSRFHEIVESGTCPAFSMGRRTEDWSNENGGRGRRIRQLSTQAKPVYAKTPEESGEKAKRMGLSVETHY